MKSTVRVLGGIGLLLLPASAAQAQFNQAQYMNNLMASAQMMQQAPWGGGSPAAAAAGFVNPYTPALAGAFSNPYAPGGLGANAGAGGYGAGAGQLYGYGFPPQIGPGYYLMGAAQVMQAYGSIVTADQQARILQEQVKQMRIENAKRRFELEMYIQANTIPYSEIQAKIAKQTLRRIRTNANDGEVWSGTSLNLLRRDLAGAAGKKLDKIEPITIQEDILKHINVTKKNGNLGLLRNDGRFNWPAALLDIVPDKERNEIDLQAQALVQKAIDGNVPGNTLRDLQNSLEQIQENLLKKVNQIDGIPYRAAKKFLDDFNSALVALQEPGNAAAYFAFQRWATGGKTAQELVDYMIRNGLNFAPAVQGDESAYQALHYALVQYDNAYESIQPPAAPPGEGKQ